MRNLDLSPLFRSTIGADRMSRLLDAAFQMDGTASYPPYNIEKLGENRYRITMAVAGFSESELDVTTKDNLLIVSGKAKPEEDGTVYLHRGIAGRAFERRFQLADYIEVKGAALVNGMLSIDLVREVPEAIRPRSIPIRGGVAAEAIEAQVAGDTKAAA